MLYWTIGKEILARQAKDGWGTGVIERLAKDLHSEFPEMQGFSPRNLGYMKAFAEAWPEESILQVALAKLNLAWYHNITILEKVKSSDERLRYAEQTIKNGWSRNVLVHQIESGLYRRQGKAQTNFAATLPPLQSDLAQQVLKTHTILTSSRLPKTPTNGSWSLAFWSISRNSSASSASASRSSAAMSARGGRGGF